LENLVNWKEPMRAISELETADSLIAQSVL